MIRLFVFLLSVFYSSHGYSLISKEDYKRQLSFYKEYISEAEQLLRYGYDMENLRFSLDKAQMCMGKMKKNHKRADNLRGKIEKNITYRRVSAIDIAANKSIMNKCLSCSKYASKGCDRLKNELIRAIAQYKELPSYGEMEKSCADQRSECKIESDGDKNKYDSCMGWGGCLRET